LKRLLLISPGTTPTRPIDSRGKDLLFSDFKIKVEGCHKKLKWRELKLVQLARRNYRNKRLGDIVFVQ
jgi:hypothetical protein